MRTPLSTPHLWCTANQIKTRKCILSALDKMIIKTDLGKFLPYSYFSLHSTSLAVPMKRICSPEMPQHMAGKFSCVPSSRNRGKYLMETSFMSGRKMHSKETYSAINGSVSRRLFSTSRNSDASASINQGLADVKNVSGTLESINVQPSLESDPIPTSTDIAFDSSANVIPTSDQELLTNVLEPTFSSLGLAHGWPSGWMQALLEFLHIHTEISWGGTIVLSR